MGRVGQGGACRRARPSQDLGHLGRRWVLGGKSPKAGLSRWPRGLLKSSFVLRGAGPGRGGRQQGPSHDWAIVPHFGGNFSAAART